MTDQLAENLDAATPDRLAQIARAARAAEDAARAAARAALAAAGAPAGERDAAFVSLCDSLGVVVG